jgi:hypothetical protein
MLGKKIGKVSFENTLGREREKGLDPLKLE